MKDELNETMTAESSEPRDELVRRLRDEIETLTQRAQAKEQEIAHLKNDQSMLLSNISHELRTPLNSILILSEIFSENRDGNLTSKQRELAETIYNSGMAMSELVNEFLDFTSLETKTILIHPEEIRLRDVLGKLTTDFAPRFAQKGLNLHAEFAEDLPALIQTGRQEFLHVMQSLMSNALKFTHKGEVRVSAFRPAPETDLTASGLAADAAVAIAVCDTGIGIPQEKLSVIFEAFRQLDVGLTRKYEGAGLGLAVARGLAAALGGELHAQSAERRGSTFTIYLPMRYAASRLLPIMPAPPQPAPLRPAPPQPAPQDIVEISNIRDDRHHLSPYLHSILIIESHAEAANALFGYAHKDGFQCLIAEDGEGGLQLADQYSPDAILLDLELPGLNGWKVMERLKDNFQTRHIPIYLISSQKKAREAMKMGALGYIRMPIDPNACPQMFRHFRNTVASTHKLIFVYEEQRELVSLMAEWMFDTNVQTLEGVPPLELNSHLSEDTLACVVIDMNDAFFERGMAILAALASRIENALLPVIAHRNRPLSMEQEGRLKPFEDSVVFKKAYTRERLLDEVSLFLHLAVHYLPKAQQTMLELLHPTQVSLDNKSLLLVDNDMRTVFSLSGQLEEHGAEVLIAENGAEAEHLLQSVTQIDMILLNVMLPDFDAFALIQQIRNHPPTAKTPIIVMKADGVRGDRRRYIQGGANEYLAKPIDVSKLLSLLRVWLY